MLLFGVGWCCDAGGRLCGERFGGIGTSIASSRARRRPLASAAIRPRHALVFLVALLGCGLLVLLSLNRLAQCLGLASLVLYWYCIRWRSGSPGGRNW